MNYENFTQFKNHSKSLQSALNRKLAETAKTDRVKLSVVQEALAQSLGFDCLAAFKATAFKRNEQIVKEIPDNLGPFLLNVEGLVYNDDMEEESFAIIDEKYSTVHDIHRTRDYKVHRELRSEGYHIGRLAGADKDFWGQCYVKAIHIECPSIGEYGIPYFGDELTAAQRIAEQFQFKVLERPEVSIHDRGDDGGTTVFFEIWAPQSVFDKITELPLCDHDGDEV